MDTYSFGTKPTPQEHNAVLRYIKHFRRNDIIMCLIFALIGFGLMSVGIYAIIDKFQYSTGFIIVAIVFLIISLGCGISDLDRYKLICDGKYTVITCMVTGRSCTRTKYHTEYKVRVTNTNNEETSHIVSSFTYRKAGNGMKAVIVNYSSDDLSKSKIPADVVISDI